VTYDDFLNTTLKLEYVFIIIAAGCALIALVSFIWRRLGNAGDHKECCICGRSAMKYVPIIGGSVLDYLLSRHWRINGIPISYRVIEDVTDERRLCPQHWREHVARLEAAADQARADHAVMNREQLAKLQAITIDRAAPEPMPAVVAIIEEARKPSDSSIELEPIA
jgi:hypothetical protein